MNAGTYLLLTLSLLFALAVAGSAISEQRNEDSDSTTPSRIAINHNETMLSVAAPAYGLSDLLADFQAFFSKPTSGGCDEWGCGTNHNETMLCSIPTCRDSEWSELNQPYSTGIEEN